MVIADTKSVGNIRLAGWEQNRVARQGNAPPIREVSPDAPSWYGRGVPLAGALALYLKIEFAIESVYK